MNQTLNRTQMRILQRALILLEELIPQDILDLKMEKDLAIEENDALYILELDERIEQIKNDQQEIKELKNIIKDLYMGD